MRGAGAGSPGSTGSAAPRGARRVLAAHRARALALSARADMRLSLFLLLAGFAARFLALRFGEAPLVLGFASVFRSPRFMYGDGDGLLAAFDLAAFAAWAAFELAMLEFVHDASRRLPLAW